MLDVLKILVFLRPFISSLAFFWSNLLFSVVTLGFLSFWFLQRKPSLKLIEALCFPLGLFTFTLIISIVFSLNFFKSLSQAYNYLIYVLIFIAIIVLSPKEKTSILNAIIISGSIISLLAIYQYLFGFEHLLRYMAKYDIAYSFGTEYIARKRVFFPFVTPNTLAGFLILIVLLILGKKMFYSLLIPVGTAIFLTKSMGAILSLFVGLVIYLLIMKKMNLKKFIYLVSLSLVTILVFILRTHGPQEYLTPYFSLIRRFDYWMASLKVIKAHPLIGVGLGNFNLTITRYSHNLPLQIWAETGLAGIITLIWFIVVHAKLTFQNIKNSPDRNQIAGLLSANIAFLFHNLIDFTFFLPEVCFLWWVILGLCINNNEPHP